MAHLAAPSQETHYTLRLGDRGRMVLPARLRKTLGLKSGESLLLTVDTDGAMHLGARRQVVRLDAKAEKLRVKKVLEIPKFFGSGIWEGDLSGMREDQPKRRRSKKK